MTGMQSPLDVNLKYQCNAIYVYINVFIYCFNVVIIIKWKYNVCQIILSDPNPDCQKHELFFLELVFSFIVPIVHPQQ